LSLGEGKTNYSSEAKLNSKEISLK